MLAGLAIGVSAAEGIVAIGAARGLPLTWLLVCHLAILAGSGAWLLAPTARRTRFGLLLWIATAAFGPLGGPGTLLAMTLERYYARRATSPEEWHAALFPPSEPDVRAELWRRVGQRSHDQPAATDVTSFLDILTFGSVPQRQAAIAIMVQQFDPAFAPALRAALRDEHNVIRVQAATAIARLEQQFFERTVELERAIARAPDDADALLALARHCDDQAFTGLLDATREQSCRLRAAEYYVRYLALRSDDLGAEFRLARLQLRRGLAADAEPRFRRLLDAGYPAAALWLMECLFAQGRYEQLRHVAAEVSGADVQRMTPDVRTTVDLWTGTGAAA
jgi:hypothetical protein